MSIVDDFKVLEKHGFKLISYQLAKTENEAVKIAKKLKFPVAIKVVSDKISHKTDYGGVKVDIRSEQSLRIAYQEMMRNTRRFGVDGILIQKMARKGVELIVGGKKDPQFGYLVVLGFGGVYVEVFRDITARICPITKKDIREMVYELKSHPILLGMRGKKAIHLKSLEELLLRTCVFMEQEDIKEMDLNPVIFDSNGCDIIDVRFRS